MRERIRQIMENENLTPAKFADKLQINRANISHILNGRNNPSLDVVARILSEMPYINSEWLINGTGEMYKRGFDVNSIPLEHDLFHQSPAPSHQEELRVEKKEASEVIEAEKRTQPVEKKSVVVNENREKKISQIIIYYNDNTFETFLPQSAK